MTDASTVEARARYDELYQRSLERPGDVLAGAGRAARVDPQAGPRLRAWARHRAFTWFPGGRTNLASNALDRHVAAGRGRPTALITLDERGGRRTLDLRRAARRGRAGRRGAARPRDRQGRPAHDLHAHVGRGDHRDARDRPDRGDPLRRVRRLRARARWATGSGRAARASSSRRTSPTARARTSTCSTIVDDAHRLPGRATSSAWSSCGAQPRLAAAAAGRAGLGRLPRGGRGPVGRRRGHGAERSGLHPRHVRHDREAEARRPHPRRLRGPHHGDGRLGVRAARRATSWWSTSDIGWVVGHSYIVYAPLIAGATTIAYEGALDYPDAETSWAIIERERVTGVFTSPTAIRLLMRYGEDVPKRPRPDQPRARRSAPARC